MKRQISLARVMIALLIAGGVAAVHFALWAVMNRPVSVVEPLDYIDGFSYSPYRRDQTPLKGVYPSYAEIEQDMKQLGGIAHKIAEFGLAKQENLQQRRRAQLEIRQHPQLFNRFQRQILCFVDQ